MQPELFLNMKNKTGIIVVLFHSPELPVDLTTIPEDQMYILVDNTPNRKLKITNSSTLRYIPLGENSGIAKAQNIGIEAAIEAGCSHIIFFDQDSIVPQGYVNAMVKEYIRISAYVDNLFLLGPTVVNARLDEEYKSKIHTDTPANDGFIARREIISSGSCVATNRIDKVGMLDENLFIDFVDFEWCWRAVSKGLNNGITTNIRLYHFVGLQEFKIFNQLVIVSNPIRYYFQNRNYLWLLRRDYVPKQWKINTTIKKILFTPVLPFKVKEWKRIYRHLFRGLRDGMKSPDQK